MVSNCTWMSPAFSSGGRPDASSWRNRSRWSSAPCISAGGGGTKSALPGRVPPIQFCVRRNSPGAFSPPRPAAMSRAVHLADQAQREGQGVEPPQPVHHGVDVARHLTHVVEGGARGGLGLEAQQVGERRLRALDLGREHGFLADVHVEEQLLARQQHGDAVEPPERALGRGEATQEGAERRRAAREAGEEARRRARPRRRRGSSTCRPRRRGSGGARLTRRRWHGGLVQAIPPSLE